MTTFKDSWIVNSYAIMPDTRNGGTMMRLTLVNMATQITADTYVCPAHRNSRGWAEVLSQLGKGMILGGLHTSRRGGKTFVNADSKPQVLWCGDAEVLADNLAQLWSPKNNFSDLFEKG